MIADKIMDWCWGLGWDKNSPSHNWWKKQIKKKKRSTIWWKKNYIRIWEIN